MAKESSLTDKEVTALLSVTKKPKGTKRLFGLRIISLALGFLMILTAALTIGIFIIFSQKEKEVSKREKLEITMNKMQTQLSQEKSVLIKEIKKLKTDYNEKAKAGDRVFSGLAQLKEELDQNKKILEKRDVQLKDVKSKIKAISNEKSSLIKQSKELENENKELKNKLADYQKQLESIKKKAPPNEHFAADKRVINGVIQKVTPQQNIVTINLGTINGVKKGMILEILNANNLEEKIGEIKILATGETLSIAEITSKNREVTKGSKVRASRSKKANAAGEDNKPR